ncbi:MAG: glycosyltransferase family 2 protein [Rhodospirillaceae bacterium]|nr:glycosyltransferase family 2 protein [Rhodospirillaceae bacterium]
MTRASQRRAGDAVAEHLDVIVRFHDPARLRELNRCVFSLVGQTYRPVRIILALQRFSAADIATTEAALAPLLDGEPDLHLSVINWEHADPADARAVLLNLGLSVAQGRYLAFLDYDDVLYPEAYALLVERLRLTGSAIAFAAVRVMRLEVYRSYFYTAEEVVPTFKGAGLLDLFTTNFCPLHSYVIDRTAIPKAMLTFNSALVMEEDYDLLLRICAAHKSDFALIGTRIGDYYYKTDGSNTVPTQGGIPAAEYDHYRTIRAAIAHRKATTLIAPDVQRALGLAVASAPLTIADAVARMSGRTTP